MKKTLVLLAAVALMAMTACNEKPAKNEAIEKTNGNAPATENVQAADAAGKNLKVNVEKGGPTADGKDHVVAEFANKDYQVRVENLADGTYRLSLWRAGQDMSQKPEKLIETKDCLLDTDKNFIIRDADGTNYIISTKKGAEQLVVMKGNEILYPKLK